MLQSPQLQGCSVYHSLKLSSTTPPPPDPPRPHTPLWLGADTACPVVQHTASTATPPQAPQQHRLHTATHSSQRTCTTAAVESQRWWSTEETRESWSVCWLSQTHARGLFVINKTQHARCFAGRRISGRGTCDIKAYNATPRTTCHVLGLRSRLAAAGSKDLGNGHPDVTG